MKEKLTNLIKETLKSLGLKAVDFVVEHPVDLKMGDYSTNVGIKTGKAKEIITHLEVEPPSGVERMELAGPGFINFYLSKEFFRESLREIIDRGDEFGKNENLKGEKVMVEHTQPNPFKAFHIGHLMNNTIGESVARIVKANGAEVKTCSYHGDVGLHIAEAVWAIQKGIDLKQAYAYGHKAGESDEKVIAEILEINKKIYDKSDAEINKSYENGRKTSLEFFGSVYEKLDSHFDYHFYESESW